MALKVGLQLFSVRRSMEKDPLGVIEQCAEIGYKYLQIASGIGTADGVFDYVCGFGVSADVFRNKCEELGIGLLASHFNNLTPDTAREICKVQREIGVTGLITPIEFCSSVDDVNRLIEQSNAIGEICKEEGMEYFYHNHWHEWQMMEGKTFIDRLMDGTDPELVKFELDMYWAARGGQDPCEIMKQYGPRITLLHQKDFPKGMDDRLVIKAVYDENQNITQDFFMSQIADEEFGEVGTGILPIQKYIDTANELGYADYIILEQDETQIGDIASIRKSMEAFRKYSGIILD